MFNKHLSYSIILLKKYNLAGQSSAKPHPMLPIEFMLLPVSKNDLRAKLDEFFVKTYYLNKMLSKIRNLEKLNEREWILVQLVSFGMPNKQSANILTLAEKTIEKCRTGIYRKLGVHSTGELASLVSIANFYQWPVGVEFPRKR
ncbi:MAG: LuxR C-terminal-related transcriptional regulator [Planctomycetota bacterium]